LAADAASGARRQPVLRSGQAASPVRLCNRSADQPGRSARVWRVLGEQVTRGEDGETKPRPPGQAKGDAVTNPHDPEVRYGYKGEQGWVGCKLQVTDTADEGASVHHRYRNRTSDAPRQSVSSCYPGSARRARDPSRQAVRRQAYMSGYHIADSLSKGIDLRDYVREGNLSKPEGFCLRDFNIDIEQRQAICPAGKKQARRQQLDCLSCSVRSPVAAVSSLWTGFVHRQADWSSPDYQCPSRSYSGTTPGNRDQGVQTGGADQGRH
jgi:hypothetical protein